MGLVSFTLIILFWGGLVSAPEGLVSSSIRPLLEISPEKCRCFIGSTSSFTLQKNDFHGNFFSESLINIWINFVSLEVFLCLIVSQTTARNWRNIFQLVKIFFRKWSDWIYSFKNLWFNGHNSLSMYMFLVQLSLNSKFYFAKPSIINIWINFVSMKVFLCLIVSWTTARNWRNIFQLVKIFFPALFGWMCSDYRFNGYNGLSKWRF